MPFIRTQKLVYSQEGRIISGSASIVDVTYDPLAPKCKSRQKVRERLGKVLAMYSKRRGLFQSPTRGLVIYDADQDAFFDPEPQDGAGPRSDHGQVPPDPGAGSGARIPGVSQKSLGGVYPGAGVHTVFGDAYLLIEIMKKTGIWQVLSGLFPETDGSQRLLCHVLHSVLSDGGGISCEDFTARSFAAYCAGDIQLESLGQDIRYFSMMGDREIKSRFFTAFAGLMRERWGHTAHACCVDLDPLPMFPRSPFSALQTFGMYGHEVPVRLVSVLDETTRCPLWYEVIAEDEARIDRLRLIEQQVALDLGIRLTGCLLDHCYVSEDLFRFFEPGQGGAEAPEKRYLVRMPDEKEVPYRELWEDVKRCYHKPKHCFVYEGRPYFGRSVRKNISGTDLWCYVFVDLEKALREGTEVMRKYSEQFARLTAREQAWQQVRGGFLALIGNCDRHPAGILAEYLGNARDEWFTRDTGEYLKLLPVWVDETVRGKILTDAVSSIVRHCMMRLSRGPELPLSSVLGKCQSLMCMLDPDSGRVLVEKPGRHVLECFGIFGISVPREIDLGSYLRELYPVRGQVSGRFRKTWGCV